MTGSRYRDGPLSSLKDLIADVRASPPASQDRTLVHRGARGSHTMISAGAIVGKSALKPSFFHALTAATATAQLRIAPTDT